MAIRDFSAQERKVLEKKVSQHLRKAFPDEATAGQTKTKDARKASKANATPARKSLGKTPTGGNVMKGNKKKEVVKGTF